MLKYSILFIIILTTNTGECGKKLDFQNQGGVEEEEDAEAENKDGPHGKDVFDFLYSRMNQDLDMKKKLPANIYKIPGPQEPLPGRSHMGDYWPVFPFHNQYSGGVDLDPAISRHIGGDMNFAVPSWGMMDIYGRAYNRIQDTTTKIGYTNDPVNMMDLEKEDFIRLMSDPAVAANRNAHPTLPMARLPKKFTPLSCKPPLCNPYHMNFGLGLEHNYGGQDGWEGDIDVAMPTSKGIAYRFPVSGNLYYNLDNMTITYGQNLSPIEPFSSLFDYQKVRDPALRIPRRWTRSIPEQPIQTQQNERKMIYGDMRANYPTQEFDKNIDYGHEYILNDYRRNTIRSGMANLPIRVPNPMMMAGPPKLSSYDQRMMRIPFEMAMMPLFNTLPLHDNYNIYPGFGGSRRITSMPIPLYMRPRRSRRVLIPQRQMYYY